jgi:predicted porin
MQKKLIVLALAGLSAASAFAQSNVTVYGRVDYGYVSRGGSDGAVADLGRKNEMASGVQSGSRLGFKGAEDLGNGLKAIFEVESGLSNDAASTQSGGLFATNRHAYVGLTGAFGTAVGGRLDGVRYGLFNKYDAFGGGGIGNFTQMTGQVDRADNAIAYISPNFSGFTLTLAHATQVGGQEYAGNAAVAAVANNLGAVTGTTGVAAVTQKDANTGDGVLNTIMLNYENGPISLSADYEQVVIDSARRAGGVNGADKVKVWVLAGSYNFGMVKLSALYDSHHTTKVGTGDLVDYKDWFISAKVPYGKFDFKATYGQVNNNLSGTSKMDSNKIGLGVNYNLSKRTNVYFDFGTINNERNATLALNQAANSNGAGHGTNGYNLGLAHNF